MRNNMRAWLIAILVLVVGIFGLMYWTGGSDSGEVANEPAIQYGTVVIAKADIAARTVLTGEMIEVQQMPAEFIHPMALTDIEEALDMLSVLPVSAGEQMLQTKIANPDTDFLSYQLKEGHVAFTVPVTELTGAGGMIRVGDKVNVLANFGKDVAGEELTNFVLYDISIIAIGQDMAINTVAEGTDMLSTMTVEVTPEDAQKLAWAQNHGSIAFILKSVLDEEGSEEILAVSAKTFFGESDEFKDLEYLQMLSEIQQIRSIEQGVLEFGKGDVQRVRDQLKYDRFYYDDLNGISNDSGSGASSTTDTTNSNGSTSNGSTGK